MKLEELSTERLIKEKRRIDAELLKRGEVMTFEELKAEANRQGYNLVKKYQPMPKLKRCPICGSLAYVRYGDIFYVACKKGCLIGPKVSRYNKVQSKSKLESEREAREAWNEMVEKGEK